jgi:hypothetical protein
LILLNLFTSATLGTETNALNSKATFISRGLSGFEQSDSARFNLMLRTGLCARNGLSFSFLDKPIPLLSPLGEGSQSRDKIYSVSGRTLVPPKPEPMMETLIYGLLFE